MEFLSINIIESRLLCLVDEISGTDSDDRLYENISDMWDYELNQTASTAENPWYSKAYDYWENETNCPITDDGVLGGYGCVTEVDVKESIEFLNYLKEIRPFLQFNEAVDCGAGIGRVSKHLLLPIFKHVDMVEQSPRLLHSSAQYIGDDATRTSQICINLKDYSPISAKYDIIWIQWVVGHLHDLDFIRFFNRCAKGLNENGLIVLKDNIADNWTFVVDKTDSSISRCVEYYKVLFDIAGLEVLHCQKQVEFPEELSTVMMFALCQKTSK